MTEHIDIFPTICDLAGTPIPAVLQGKNLKPLMQRASTQSKGLRTQGFSQRAKLNQLKAQGLQAQDP